MRKLLGITLTLAFVALFAPAGGAKAAERSGARGESAAYEAAAQSRRQGRYDDRRYDNRRNDRRVRVTTQTRTVRVGRRVYRETYQIRHLPNGRTQTRLISRVRIR